MEGRRVTDLFTPPVEEVVGYGEEKREENGVCQVEREGKRV